MRGKFTSKIGKIIYLVMITLHVLNVNVNLTF